MADYLKNLFIVGKPGVGKTTMVKEVTLPFREGMGGFYTEEIRETGKRLGFRICSLKGEKGIFAYKGMNSSCRLNKYGIDLAILETIGVKSLEEALLTSKIILIDEIGTMEFLSPVFPEIVQRCLDSPLRVLATFRWGTQLFSHNFSPRKDSLTIELTRENFLEVKAQIRDWLTVSS